MLLPAMALVAAPAEPVALSTWKDMEQAVKQLPTYAPLSFSGVAFFHGKLYVSSNAGLWVISGTTAEALLRFRTDDAVVEGPWLDRANDCLWIQQAADIGLFRFDGRRWESVDFPQTQLTRGDVLNGFRIIAGRRSTWLIGAGKAWRFNPSQHSWTMESVPVSPLSTVILIDDLPLFVGLSPRSNTVLEQYIKRVDAGDTKAKAELEALVRDPLLLQQPAPVYVVSGKATSQVPDRTSKPFVPAKVASTIDSAYVCTRHGDVARVTRAEIASVEAPGQCEAIAADSKGTIAASFARLGLYELSNHGWSMRVPAPLGRDLGPHYTYLAKDGDRMAYAISRKASLSRTEQIIHSRTTALFVGQKSQLVPVHIPGLSP